jgi:hypothetical protein
MTLNLNSDARRLASTALQGVVNRGMAVSNGLANFLAGVGTPPDLSAFIKEAESLRDMMATGDANVVTQFDLEPQALTLLRAALSTERRSRAERIEDGQRHITSASVSRALDESLRPLNDFLEQPVLRRVVPRPMPTLADFVTPEGRKNFDPISSLAAEEKEPKNRILLSASLINSDLSIYRRHCEDRRLPFACVFADLDDFKKINSAIGEVAVDRQVLPRILAAVESAASVMVGPIGMAGMNSFCYSRTPRPM